MVGHFHEKVRAQQKSRVDLKACLCVPIVFPIKLIQLSQELSIVYI